MNVSSITIKTNLGIIDKYDLTMEVMLPFDIKVFVVINHNESSFIVIR